jgi:hypothetical protein
MNRRKALTRLKDLGYPKMNKMVREAGIKWTRRLHSAAIMGRNSWLQEIRSVEGECVLVREILASLPMCIISEYIIDYGIREFANIIASYDCDSGRPLISRICDRKIHQDICLNILKTVVFPCISTYDVSKVASEFVQELLIKLLYIIPNVQVLILPKSERLKYMQLLVTRIQVLVHLQEFHFNVGCTTEILIKLSKYCPRLTTISVRGSKRVNDKCVRYILRLRSLLVLNIATTSVSANSYTQILSGLPEIRNVIWSSPLDPVLSNLREPLPSVKTFTGNISDAGLLVHNCPNITELTLLSITEDISGLGALRSVTTLSMGFSIDIRFSNVITLLGPTLTVLKMANVAEININDVFDSCTVLNSLSISICYIDFRQMPSPELPHFRNLKELRLRHNWGPFDFSSILHLYINLSVLRVVGMEQINDVYMRQIVTAGGFRNLTEIVIDLCGFVSMQTAWLLVQYCPNLIVLGKVSGWSHVTTQQIVIFLDFVKSNNLALVLFR